MYLSDFSQKTDGGEMKVAKHNINTKWIYVGTSLAVFCIAVAVAIRIIRLARKNFKGNINFILI